MYYTGIGSRETPTNVLKIIKALGTDLGKLGIVLRSGGANGADKAFEEGCDSVNGKKEIFLPWKNFNNNKSLLFKIPNEAFEIAKTIHPAWHACNFAVKKLHARNVLQILGSDLKTPSNFVICWTKNGKAIGGTRYSYKLGNSTSH